MMQLKNVSSQTFSKICEVHVNNVILIVNLKITQFLVKSAVLCQYQPQGAK